ncbi:Rossmann-fold NAD(P)-binding domain-containing protein [Streptomyces goshikiensis]|uniref:monooxygenase n=1 Tax=Streptomyces goshikiensis TaxID=1942 RepID=UPI0036A576BB
MHRNRVAIIGGSIAGCAFARAAVRAGIRDVTVFERAEGQLQDRGLGIGIQADRYRELAAANYLDEETPCFTVDRRLWLAYDGNPGTGRLVWSQRVNFRFYVWGMLWRGLRDRVPAEVDYRDRTQVTRVEPGEKEVQVEFSDGSADTFDAVIGTDGYRSVVRTTMFPQAFPYFAGYVMFRGALPVTALPPHEPGDDRTWAGDSMVTISVHKGQFLAFRMPGSGGDMVNWAFYTVPDSVKVALKQPTSLPPGTLDEQWLHLLLDRADSQLPSYWRDMVRSTAPSAMAMQPIYDVLAPCYAQGRFALGGDAAALVRPHIAGSTIKALQDASAFAVACAKGLAASSWPNVLAAYGEARRPVGEAQFRQARHMGRAQVYDEIDWATLTAEGAAAWWADQGNDIGSHGGRPMSP